MKVYVLLRGFEYEGETVIGVYSTPGKAAEAEAADKEAIGTETAATYWKVREFEVQ